MGGWNGVGIFEKTYSWVQDQINGIKIRADRHDVNDTDFTNGINNCLTKDGQNAATANLPMATFKHTSVGNATARNQYLAMGQQQDASGVYYATTGSANAYVLTPSPAITAYAEGQRFYIKANFTNSAASTIAISGLTTKALTKNGTTAIASGDIVSGTIYEIEYDGTQFQILNSNIPSNLSVATLAVSGVSNLTGLVTLGAAVNEFKGTNIASATTTDIGAAVGNFVHITGTVTITGLGTIQAGTRREVVFDGILTLTHNGTSLILPGAANITTAAGDSATFESEGSGNWKCVKYMKASGRAVIEASSVAAMTILTSSSGTWTSPSDTTSATVFKFTVVGAGGGGGGTNATGASAGGGGGGTAIYVTAGLAASTGYSYAVGTGGTGGSAGANDGTAGGDSTITLGGTTPTGGGGALGLKNSATPPTGGAGGTASNGTINLTGGGGGGGSSSNVIIPGGTGGNSYLGAGGYAGGGGSVTTGGGAGGNYGGGGGGAGGNNTSRAGGNGANGVIIVERLSG